MFIFVLLEVKLGMDVVSAEIRYWRDALDAKKEALIRFLQNGSLGIVGGDGVMNDENFYEVVVRLSP
uniref:Putative glycoside hydrolase 38/57, N-terminal domain-containing protein n=1 Tax=Helianthus annuus TaxID=4232 RepID=A0A251TPA0_HELAN